MTVNFTKPAHILTVHGVQTGTDADITSTEKIDDLVRKALARSHITREFEARGYFYEDINDQAQRFYRLLASAITAGTPLVSEALDTVIDLAGDVVTASANTSTAKKIRRRLRKKILESYDAGHPLLLVSHSLGTVYSLMTIAEMMAEAELFKGDNRKTWPVQGLITMGSPLGLELDFGGLTVFEKVDIPALNARFEAFPWHNFFNRLDPVVSGSVFGKPVDLSGSRGPVENRYGADVGDRSWLLHGHAITSGRQWLISHTAYWNNPRIGDRIVDMIWG